MREHLETYFALARWYANKGYSLRASFRLARWCLTPELSLYPEHQ